MEANYYAIIPANVRYHPELCDGAKLLYGEITALCQKEGYCWASNAYFAELYHKDKRTISRRISSLAKLGFVELGDSSEAGERQIILSVPCIKKQEEPTNPHDKNVYRNNTR